MPFYFNSIKVRLELPYLDKIQFNILDFNSIKVRLELDMLIFSLPFRGFQFHKGAIRTNSQRVCAHLCAISIP